MNTILEWKMLRNGLLATAALALLVTGARAAVQTKEVAYSYDGVNFKGHLAWDDATSGKRPGVLVVHEWWGLNDYAKQRAEKLAALGYVAFACDMYGEGKLATHPQEAGEMAGEVRKNIKTWQGRARAALKVLQEDERVDPRKIAAIGYCFGGSTALELAYTGADLAAVATFHGALPLPDAEQAKAIRAKVLICHGARDNFIPEETIHKVRAAFEEAGVDYEMVYYGGAVHSFTVPDANKVGMPGMAYNAEADRRSWRSMLRLFDEVFKPAN
ncbi:MAG: dienelactone hydrolase family protein [Isosphaeraceae bacterium]